MEPLIKQMLRVAACGESLKGANRWDAELDWVEENCLAAMLCYLTNQGEDRPLCTSDQQLQGALLTARVVSQTLISAMTEILDACKSHGQKIVLLKGISICEQHYPLSYLRPMRDLDFLVLEKDLSKTEDILRQLGYIQKSDYPASFYVEMHHSMPFYHPETGVWVEVHTALFPAKSRIHDSAAFCHDNVMANLVASIFNERNVFRLSDELQLLYTAAHWCSDLKIIGGSIALFDIIFLFRNNPELDWSKILSWLADESLRQYLFTALSYLKRNNIRDIQDEIYNQLEIEFSAATNFNIKILHLIIDSYLVAGKPFGSMLTSSNVGIVWKTLLQSDQPLINLVSLPGNILFPPNNPRRFDLRFQYQRLRNSIKLFNDN
jgi:hypothetical protein